MDYIAKWGPKGFVLSTSKVVPLIDLTTAVALNSDSGTDTSGATVSNAKNLDPQQIEFATTYLRAAGVDPRAQYEEWTSLVGSSYPFFIGGKRFGPEKMTLTSISLSDVQISAMGEFLAATISVVLKQAEIPKVKAAYVDPDEVNGSRPMLTQDTPEYYDPRSQIDPLAKQAALYPTIPLDERFDDGYHYYDHRTEDYTPGSPTAGGGVNNEVVMIN